MSHLRAGCDRLARLALRLLAPPLIALAPAPVSGAPAGDAGWAPPPAPMIESAADDGQEIRAQAPARIGRVSLLAGEASWFAEPASKQGWIRALPNLPIVVNSSLSTAPGARAEIRIGTTTVGLDGNSQADFLRLDDERLTVRVVRGRVAVSIATLSQDESVELLARATGLVASTAGSYRLGIDAPAERIVAKVHDGQADLRLGEASLPLFGSQQAAVDDAGPLSHDRRQVELDDFDRWAAERASHWNVLSTAQLAPADMTGAELLESHGEWQPDPAHGTVWYPHGVDGSWAPHRDGRWATLAPVGQVWVATVPWGFATTYYGHWQRIRDRWGWVPGIHGRRPGVASAAPAPATAPGGAAALSGPARPIGRPVPFGGSLTAAAAEVGRQRLPIASAAPAPTQTSRQHHPPSGVSSASGGTTFADPPRAYPTPSRLYPTPPRHYPTPPRAWPQDHRRANPK